MGKEWSGFKSGEHVDYRAKPGDACVVFAVVVDGNYPDNVPDGYVPISAITEGEVFQAPVGTLTRRK